MYETLRKEREAGAKSMRDNVIAHIIGMQNEMGNDVNDKGYQALDKLLDLITERYGKMFGEFLG